MGLSIDRKKVIKGISQCWLPRDSEEIETQCVDCPYFDPDASVDDCMAELRADAINLLKEQEEPKQIVRKNCKEVHDDGSIYYFAEWYCPHCNMLILRGFDNPSIKFCYKCGKPIVWE